MTGLITWWREAARVACPEADPGRVLEAGADLLARWTQPHRRYHTTQHLEEVLGALDDLTTDLGAERDAYGRLAAWFHDAVYAVDAPAGDNERRSAHLAEDGLRDLGADPTTVVTVVDLVEMTADHAPGQHDPLRDCFHDADLWILSAGRHRFDEYCAQVREEYSHVPDEAYGRGRSTILRPLLERPHLYRTARARSTWTDTARANLARELDRLTT